MCMPVLKHNGVFMCVRVRVRVRVRVTSHIENSKNTKVILLYHSTLSYVNVQQYSKITFLLLLFSMCEGLSP